MKTPALIGHSHFDDHHSATKETVLSAVEKAMQRAHALKQLSGDHLFLKANLLSFLPVPGQCTSPWVVEGTVRILQEAGFRLSIGDANVATRAQVERAAQVWGTKKLCKQYSMQFVNLSKQRTRRVNLDSEIFHHMEIPQILLDVDGIVTLPVLKMHNVTGMTFSLKNQWGCLTTVRQRYHLVAHKCIPEINRFLNVVFAVGDATVCQEGDGPVTGQPRTLNSVLASADRVALDSAGCYMMGIDPSTIRHIVHAQKLGLGSMKYTVNGDPLPQEPFAQPVLKNHPIVHAELAMRKIPGLRWLVFDTPFFRIPAFIASRYNTIYWYHRYGKRYAKKFLDAHPLYQKEFLSFHSQM